MNDIIWGDPPTTQSTGRRGVVQRFVEQLSQRPGEWAKYPHVVHQSAVTHNKARFPGTEWTSRKRDDGRYDLYARWTGE